MSGGDGVETLIVDLPVSGRRQEPLEDLMDCRLAEERLERHGLYDAQPFSRLKEHFGLADDFEDKLV